MNPEFADCMEAAHYLYDFGFKVAPMKPGGKHSRHPHKSWLAELGWASAERAQGQKYRSARYALIGNLKRRRATI